MNSTWVISQEEQLAYLKAMTIQYFDIYKAHAFSERQHFWSKNDTLKNYLIPTLLEYSHNTLSKPNNILELMEYRRSKRQLVEDILQMPDARRQINSVIKKLTEADEWERIAGVAFQEGGDVNPGFDLADLFGLGDLMAWAIGE
ncbi:hypothetical protein BCR42DRAFT_451891 [Absidia repens]|uniref:Uncharacterized protein n=1 Tax=Absidia repens TaxID=90262 RepID=A0A1X2IEB7_9FUNG|nr:hypothetical protein BCR42DRAFT_451891 [Absidia repens]